MKKIILIILVLITIAGCSAQPIVIPNNLENEGTITEYDESEFFDIITIPTERCMAYFGQDEYKNGTYKVDCMFWDTIFLDINEQMESKFPKEKRKKLYELANFDGEYSMLEKDGKKEPSYALSELLCIKYSPSQYDLLPGDVVTCTVGIREGINLTIEQVEETLGVKFIPYEYTVK